MAASVKPLSKIDANAYADNFRGGRVMPNHTGPPDRASNAVATEVRIHSLVIDSQMNGPSLLDVFFIGVPFCICHAMF